MKNSKILKYLSEKYERYNIPLELITRVLDEEQANNYNYSYLLLEVSTRIESYIVKKMRSENSIDYELSIIDDYSHLKFIIKKNNKYLNIINALASKEKTSTEKIINKIYEDAIERLFDNYDNSKLLSENILINLKKILVSSSINKLNYKKSDAIELKKDMQEEKNNKAIKQSNREEKYDISFLKDYLKNNNIPYQLLANALSIKLDALSNYLYGNSLAPESIVDKLVKLFNVKDYNELKEKVTKNELEVPKEWIQFKKEKRYDISFLKDYLKNNNISHQLLADALSIKLGRLSNYLYGNSLAPESIVDKLVKLFNVKDYNELKEKVTKNELEVPKEWIQFKKEKRYDISFLKDYLKNNNISYQLLADALSIKLGGLNSYLYGKSLAPESIVDKLVKLFNVKDYDELKEKVTKNELEVPKEWIQFKKEKRYDISFLRDYLKNNNISHQLLADALSIKLSTLNGYLYGNSLAPESIVDKLVKLFNVKDYDELKEKVINNELVIPQILLLNRKRKETDSNIVIEGKSLAQSCKLNTSKNNKYNISNAQQMVNIECLLDLIDISTISKLDYFIMMLLFGGIEGKYYNVDAISNFLNVDIIYIYNIFIECLKLYKNSFNNAINDECILSLKNIDESK